jgi:hypothetical protein
VFFILVTAGMIGGLFWLYGGNLTKDNNATVLKKTIKEQDSEIASLKQQIADDKTKYAQLSDGNAKWQTEKAEYDKRFKELDGSITRIADYFSLFPQVSLPLVTVNVKDDIPRKDGELGRLNEILGFNGTMDPTWNVKDLLSVRITCSDDRMTCQMAGPPTISTSGNVLMGIPWRLYAQKDDSSWEIIAEFELVVTKDGISVHRFNDDLWHQYVAAELKKQFAEGDAPFESTRMVKWYEDNVKDTNFVLDEAMLKKIGDLGPDSFTNHYYADVVRLIELRKDYYAGRLSLTLAVDVKLRELTDKIKREKPEKP